MEQKLPKNWVEVDLDSVLIKMSNGSGLKQASEPFENSFPISRIETIWNESIDLERVKFVKPSEDEIDKYSLKKNDILFSHINSDKHLGKTALFDLDITLIHGINLLLLRTNKIYLGKLLNYYLRHLRYSGKFIEVAQRSVNQSSINQKKLKEFKVPLIPLEEQQRIVQKLDSLFAELDTIKKRLANIPSLLKNFRQSVLNQAVTGKLTEEWRKGKDLESFKLTKPEKKYRDFDLQLPEYWKIFSFESIANINSNLKDPKDYLNHVLVAPNHIEKNTGILTQIEYTRDIKPKSDKHFFRQGSIIYSKIRPYLNKVILADFDGLCSADMYPITSEIKREYLFYYMLSSVFLSYATTAGERSVLPKINQKSLNIIPVPVPSLKEQTEIVKRVETLFKQADNIQAHYEALVKRIEVLPQTILAKAFKGELVQQLPTDGDAKELLEEIKKLKEVATPKKKKRTVKK